MKMNDTVARIVEIMFQDVVQNDETAAIRDEVMNNCQDRYSDLVNSGIGEDDAVAAVIESLKGMEEILAPYKKSEQIDDIDDEEPDGEQRVSFAADLVHQIDVALVNEDVAIEASGDDCFHVAWNEEDNPLVNCELHNGVLRVVRRAGDVVKMSKEGQIEYHHKDDMSDFVRTEKGKIEINLNSIDGMLKSIGNSLKNTFANVHINVGSFGDSGVIIQVPEKAIPHVKLLTTSGDIDVQDVALADLNVTSTSGDVDIDLEEEQYLSRVELRTISGDIESTFFAPEAVVSSTSGDISIEGRIAIT